MQKFTFVVCTASTCCCSVQEAAENTRNGSITFLRADLLSNTGKWGHRLQVLFRKLVTTIAMLAKKYISDLRVPDRDLDAGRYEGALWENDRGFGTLGMFPTNVLSTIHEIADLHGVVNNNHSPFEQDLWIGTSCRKQGIAYPSAGHPYDRECGSSVAGR